MSVRLTSRFDAPDSDDNFSSIVSYLDTLSGLAAIGVVREILTDWIRVSDQARIAELGCGVGDHVAALARSLSASGHVTGYDISRRLIDLAQSRHGDVANATYVCADATAIPAPGSSLDSLWIERVLMHVEDVGAVLEEARRLLAPQGRIAISEPDWRSLTIDHPDAATTGEIVGAYRLAFKTPTIGSELSARLVAAGFDVHRIQTVEWTAPVLQGDSLLRYERMLQIALSHGVAPSRLQAWRSQLGEGGGRAALTFHLVCGASR